MVFLGGLPYDIDRSYLQLKLAELGYSVINKLRVLRGFCPQVCLRSVEEAQHLIKQGSIIIDGHQVDVREYKPPNHLKKIRPEDVKRGRELSDQTRLRLSGHAWE